METRCWICGRSELEVNKAVAGKTDNEVELEKKIASVEDSRNDYTKSFQKWAKSGDPKLFVPYEELQQSRERARGEFKEPWRNLVRPGGRVEQES